MRKGNVAALPERCYQVAVQRIADDDIVLMLLYQCRQVVLTIEIPVNFLQQCLVHPEE